MLVDFVTMLLNQEMPSESMPATTHSSPICISLDVSAIIDLLLSASPGSKIN